MEKRNRWTAEEYPEEYQPASADLPEQEIDAPETIDLREQALTEADLMEIGQRALGAPEQDSYGPEDSHDVGIVFEGRQLGHTAPEGTCVNFGSLICDRIADIAPAGRMDLAYSTYFEMETMLGDGFRFEDYADASTTEAIHAMRKLNTQEYAAQDILDGFDPSGAPPRIAFKLAPSRLEIEREITDLLRAKPNEPPAMIEVALNDSRYLPIHRAHSTLVIKRKGIDSYKGRLCVRGDTVPHTKYVICVITNSSPMRG